jgi:hypothetical protein
MEPKHLSSSPSLIERSLSPQATGEEAQKKIPDTAKRKKDPR